MRTRVMVTVLAIAGGLVAAAPAAATAPAPTAAPTWRIQLTPLPDVGNDISFQYGELTAVSCPSATFCTALGDGEIQGPALLGGEWDGSKWHLHQVNVDLHAQGFSVGGISCINANACYAAVESSNADINSFAFGLVWNGRRWRQVNIPGENNANGDLLNGISCPSTQFCMAVGQIGSRLYTVAWNGTKWRVVPVAKSRVQQFRGVSCAAADACTAVGFSPGGGRLGLIERWNGRSWNVQPTPVVAHAHAIKLWSVSCTARNACVAVGDYVDRAGNEHGFAERWGGQRWRRLTLTNDTYSNLSSVSCTANNACTAIGYADHNAPAARSWNGSGWTRRLLPRPRGDVTIDTLSCATAGNCMVVGSAHGNSNPLAISYWQ